MSLIGRKYAQALFTVAIEKNQVEEIFSDFTMVIDLLRSEKDLMNLMLTPSLNSEEKKGILSRVFKSISNKYVKNYLMLK